MDDCKNLSERRPISTSGSAAGRWGDIVRRHEQWWAGQAGGPRVWYERRQAGLSGRAANYNSWHCQYAFSIPAEEVILDFQAAAEATEYFCDAFPYFFVNFGPGLLAVALGCEPQVAENTVWFHPPAEVDITKLKLEFNQQHPWWRRMLELTKTACRILPEHVPVGFTDIGGNLDILASLLGTETLLMALTEHAEAVEASVERITDVWIEAYQQLYEIISRHRPGTTAWPQMWARGKMYMLQSDFAYMITPEMFSRFVMPDLRRCCRYLDYPFYHLDGQGQIPHLPQLLSIENLRGIQWVPGDGSPPPAKWLKLYPQIIEAGKLIQVYGSASELLQLLDQIDRAQWKYFQCCIFHGTDSAVEEMLERGRW